MSVNAELKYCSDHTYFKNIFLNDFQQKQILEVALHQINLTSFINLVAHKRETEGFFS